MSGFGTRPRAVALLSQKAAHEVPRKRCCVLRGTAVLQPTEGSPGKGPQERRRQSKRKLWDCPPPLCPTTTSITRARLWYFPRGSRVDHWHPTQKPVELAEYLIKTYTNPGDTVLDNCMGSGTTGVACLNTGRKFIGIEKYEKYFAIAKRRIEEA
jgi:DNA modification methylase